jgi:hypothetical protein
MFVFLGILKRATHLFGLPFFIMEIITAPPHLLVGGLFNTNGNS